MSPVKHIQLVNEDMSNYDQKIILQNVVEKAKEQGIALVMSSHLNEKEAFLLRPSIRITCSILLDEEAITDFGHKLHNICNSMFCRKLERPISQQG